MGNSTNAPNSVMINDGTGKSKIHGGPGGWYRTHADGQVELIHAMSGVVETPPITAAIASVTNPSAKEYVVGDNIDFKVTWDEPVNIIGLPIVTFNVGGSAKVATLIGGDKVGATRTTYRYVADEAGILDQVDTAVSLNGATIISTDDGVSIAILDFPADYDQPIGVSIVEA